MMLQPKMLFGKKKKTESHKRDRKSPEEADDGGGRKVQKYNGSEVVQHIETSIYRGGTTAREWQASGMHQEHLCTYKQHTQTYAQW